MKDRPFVTRGGEKLAAALEHFEVNVADAVCADLGSHVGGFVDCLLQNGAARVYSVDTSYGTLAWKLRKDPRVIVLERTNALHVTLREAVDWVTVDVGWTKQERVLENAARLLKPNGGCVLTLIKPHYEAPRHWLIAGVLPAERVEEVVAGVLSKAAAAAWRLKGIMSSPLPGHGGNIEKIAWLDRDPSW